MVAKAHLTKDWKRVVGTNSFIIISNSGGAIYSVDIHPNGTKMATCGQGGEGGSGLVIVWNVKPVINEKASQDASCSRLLSRILHQSNFLKFSKQNFYYAWEMNKQWSLKTL